MITITIITISTLAALLMIQVLLAIGFVQKLKQPKPTPPADTDCPKTALIICVRGNDPTLADCLHSALNQDHPDYAVHIIVDSRSDPAWPLVNNFVRSNDYKNATVHVLAQPRTTCSLKCSSLIQVISALDPSAEIIALLDTDAVPHASWLRDLITPMHDPAVGAATGNRWFAPSPESPAPLARHAWNAAAVVLMYWLDVAWGGSLALRRTVIDQGNLLNHWSQTYGDDTCINPALKRLGLRLEFVPAATLMGRQNTHLSEVTEWVTRQLLSCRLHHGGWWGVVGHGAGTSLALAAGTALLAISLATQQWPTALPMAAALTAYLATMAALLTWLESSVNTILASRSDPNPAPTTPLTLKNILNAILYAQAIYAFALVKASFARTVEWRGIRYQTRNAANIRMAAYRPLTHVRHDPTP